MAFTSKFVLGLFVGTISAHHHHRHNMLNIQTSTDNMISIGEKLRQTGQTLDEEEIFYTKEQLEQMKNQQKDFLSKQNAY